MPAMTDDQWKESFAQGLGYCDVDLASPFVRVRYILHRHPQPV